MKTRKKDDEVLKRMWEYSRNFNWNFKQLTDRFPNFVWWSITVNQYLGHVRGGKQMNRRLTARKNWSKQMPRRWILIELAKVFCGNIRFLTRVFEFESGVYFSPQFWAPENFVSHCATWGWTGPAISLNIWLNRLLSSAWIITVNWFVLLYGKVTKNHIKRPKIVRPNEYTE